MIALLMNFGLMGVLLFGLIKAYCDIPLLNENPRTSGMVTVAALLLIMWIFPRIIGFLIKFACFATVVYFICHAMGWNLAHIGEVKDDIVKELQDKRDDLDDTIGKLKDGIVPDKKYTVTPSGVVTGSHLQFDNETVQLYGIDAPFGNQTCKNATGLTYNCSMISQQKLSELVNGKQLTCTDKGKGKNGHRLVSCSVDGDDLAALMVRSGWAVADRDVTNTYVSDEKSAHDHKIGLWAGKFQAPWVWRQMVESNTSSSQNQGTNKSNEDTGAKSSSPTPFEKLKNLFNIFGK